MTRCLRAWHPATVSVMNAPGNGADGSDAADAGTAQHPPDRVQSDPPSDERAALRRVATLVAGGARRGEVFTAVADELGRCSASSRSASGFALRSPWCLPSCLSLRRSLTGSQTS
jgi:hypothetical protein